MSVSIRQYLDFGQVMPVLILDVAKRECVNVKEIVLGRARVCVHVSDCRG